MLQNPSERKAVNRIWCYSLIGMFLAVSLGSSCALTSSRRTPVVNVVRGFAPSVVNIQTEQVLDLRLHPDWGRYGEELDAFFRDYFGNYYSGGTVTLQSLGSGVILNSSGIIVTNAHVVQRATSIYVVLSDGTTLESELAGLSTEDDLAIIRVRLPHPVREMNYAAIEDVMIGETVIAIGNPLGLENSVTTGVISGIDRSFSSPQCGYECSGLLQTDASINPGNSGGALFNLDGELLGINLAVVQGAQNIGFAIPVSRVQRLLKTIR